MSAKYVLVKIKKEGSMSYRVYRVKKRIKMNCPPLYCIISKNEDEIKFTYNKNEINDNQQWYEITIGIDEDLYHYLYSYAGKNLRPIKLNIIIKIKGTIYVFTLKIA